jgi:hypothetical protein
MAAKTYAKSVLPWFLLGPLTGPLAEGIVRNWRAGNAALAWLYGFALVMTTYDLYALGGWAVSEMAQLHPTPF